jgi:hypothetical protein
MAVAATRHHLSLPSMGRVLIKIRNSHFCSLTMQQITLVLVVKMRIEFKYRL